MSVATCRGRMSVVVCVLAAGAWVGPAVQAQRKPVLPQINVPHPYYFRELYLPQLTTGPSAVAWSPEGDALVYAMGGSLWRQQTDSDQAVQLTDGPGYDYQPDWSPDGRWIVLVTYVRDAVQLRLLDVASGTARTLLDNGAVNVEPRWSPDGTRLAWVSTAYEGRFHVFVATFRNGVLGTPERITEDRDSGLPRYYYSKYDHYLSPTWSPDGSELIVVSNRGRIWGTGGFWRMPARPGGSMRELRYEETNWKARPDWSRDGRRIVYASYASAPWHQLWLMTSEGGDVFQLTYGEFDATNPRWAPDAHAIAYISNERGGTSLWTVTIPGGARREVVATKRRWKDPVGTVRLEAVDADTQRPLPLRLSVRSADGRHFAPDDAWMHADDGFDRRQRKFEFAYFHADGPQVITVPAGVTTIEAMRGLDYEHVVREVTVRPGETTTVHISMRRVSDLTARGWIAGDLHVHMNYGGTYRNTPEHLVAQARAEGVQVVENLVVNKEGRIPDVAHFSSSLDRASTGDVILKHDQEFHTSYWGHTGMLGLTSHLLLPTYAAYANTPAASLAPLNADVLRQAREQGAMTGYVHPFDAWPDPDNTTRPLTNEFPVDLALGLVDYYEALGFVDDLMANQRVWYAALNAGFRLPAGAGTDAMANYTSLRGPVGMNRVYVKVDGPVTYRAFLDAIKGGRTFATNGPLLEFSIDGHDVGDDIALPRGSHTLTARVRMRSFVTIDTVEIVSNGTVVARVPTSQDGRQADVSVPLPVTRSSWFVLRASTAEGRHPVLDLMPLGTTSPIYVTVGGAPIRSPEDARYFLAWIDRLRANVTAFTGWNDAREQHDALAQLDAARAEFERRAVPVSR